MAEIKNGMYLYHGSYIAVSDINLDASNNNKDFGKGFYLTTSKKQAISFIHLSLKKAKYRKVITEDVSKGYLSIFEIVDVEKLKIKYFNEANVEWLHFVSANRDDSIFSDILSKYIGYDVYVGKIANDRTAPTLQAYLAGVYGKVGTKEADEAAIKILLPNKLEDQVCIKTMKAVKALKFIGAERYD